MNTYLVYSGYAFNGIALFAILSMILFVFKKRRINQKRAVEHAQKQLQYQEELEVAKLIWQRWHKELLALNQDYAKETNYLELVHFSEEWKKHLEGGEYYFPSINRRVFLPRLAKEQNWISETQ